MKKRKFKGNYKVELKEDNLTVHFTYISKKTKLERRLHLSLMHCTVRQVRDIHVGRIDSCRMLCSPFGPDNLLMFGDPQRATNFEADFRRIRQQGLDEDYCKKLNVSMQVKSSDLAELKLDMVMPFREELTEIQFLEQLRDHHFPAFKAAAHRLVMEMGSHRVCMKPDMGIFATYEHLSLCGASTVCSTTPWRRSGGSEKHSGRKQQDSVRLTLLDIKNLPDSTPTCSLSVVLLQETMAVPLAADAVSAAAESAYLNQRRTEEMPLYPLSVRMAEPKPTPQWLLASLGCILVHGAHVPGIFRVPGSSTDTRSLKQLLRTQFDFSVHGMGCTTLAGFIKTFLSSIDGTILGHDVSNRVKYFARSLRTAPDINANSTARSLTEEETQELDKILSSVPEKPHRDILEHVVAVAIGICNSETRIDLNCLGMLFMPCFFPDLDDNEQVLYRQRCITCSIFQIVNTKMTVCRRNFIVSRVKSHFKKEFDINNSEKCDSISYGDAFIKYANNCVLRPEESDDSGGENKSTIATTEVSEDGEAAIKSVEPASTEPMQRRVSRKRSLLKPINTATSDTNDEEYGLSRSKKIRDSDSSRAPHGHNKHSSSSRGFSKMTHQ